MSVQRVSYNPTPGLFWLVVSPIGRVSREAYWLGFLLVWLVIGLSVNMWLNSLPPDEDLVALDITHFMASNALFPILFLVLQWTALALVIKRCQDIGFPGLAAILIFIPVVSLVVIIGLGFFPSQNKPNRYGPFPNSYFRGKS
ncbi:DUF805 domain-containing protein [Roseibium sp. CAU 1637]|uniref:DUF805 domain-containing protein n=2 Tax=Roseibium TaxID=150830 RepID=A0A939EP28_9HYPH|nr:DUF805 domain-containing protein [Roseibium limicola]MBO0345705.1 DUF805 domain-containing protein [Roseibium limicola]